MWTTGFSPYGPPWQILHHIAPSDPSTPRLDGSHVKLSFFNLNSFSWVNLSCYRVLRRVQQPWCCGEDLPQSGRFWRGHHHLQQDTGCLQARVPALLPYCRARDTGHRRYCAHLLRGQAPLRGMAPWTTSQRPSSSLGTVRHIRAFPYLYTNLSQCRPTL
jgi:hypothetical protein